MNGGRRLDRSPAMGRYYRSSEGAPCLEYSSRSASPPAWASPRRGGPMRAGYPTAYLLSRPAVARVQIGQRRPGAVVMMIQNGAADARDIEEAQLPREEAGDRRLVGRGEHRPARSAPPGDFVTEL